MFLSLVIASTLGFQQPNDPKNPDVKQPTAEKTKDEAKPEKPKELPIDGLKFRSLGPGLTSGRIVDFAVDPKNRARYFVAVASGGVWKTTNAGTTWTPIFDEQGSFSIGCITMDPNDSNTLWVGTGENNSQRSVGYGDGVYKSTDGGKTWKNVGLKTSEHIGRIVVVKADKTKIVYVAAQGPLWGPGGDRGLYRSIDDGKTWKKVLEIDENTGVNDIEVDPRDPKILLASSYQRRRRVWTLIDGGPGSGIHRSTDHGKTWTEITAGLPKGDLGRIGMCRAPSDPDMIYAIVEAAKNQGGLYRSTDNGLTWSKQNSYDEQGQYYSHVFVDPKDKNHIFMMNTMIQESKDGGKTLSSLNSRNKHVDNHVMWIDPNDTSYYLVGCDGGVYDSYDRGNNWSYKSNLPVTQFYDVGVDQNSESGPYYEIYGGTQDNNTFGGPVRTRSDHGILNEDWRIILGGDGFHCKVDPTDPNIIYAEYQYAGLARYDRRTGTSVSITPIAKPGEKPIRWNWDCPLLISPHNPKRIFFAGNRLYQSDDRGNSWNAISPDLTRQLDRNQLKIFGVIQPVDAVARHVSTSEFGNCVALAESQFTEGLIYVGTDDGLLQVTKDNGKTWTKVDKFPNVPNQTYVSKIITSHHDADTMYISFDAHKDADFHPYLLKSTDAGKTFTSIVGNLPERGTVYAIAEDHKNPKLLFCGTEFGVYFTVDGGTVWQQLKNGIPTIQCKDVVVQRANDDLVVATFGRGFYILDDYTPLRHLSKETLEKDAAILPIKPTELFAQSSKYGGGTRGSQGASMYVAPNPPYGVVITYHLKSVPKVKKTKPKPGTFPDLEKMRAEEKIEPPVILMSILNDKDEVIRNLKCDDKAGLKRISWDMREANTAANPFASGGGIAVPGNYKAVLGQRVEGKYTALTEPVAFTIVPDSQYPLTDAQYAEIKAYEKQLDALVLKQVAYIGSLNEVKSELNTIKNAFDRFPTSNAELQAKTRKMLEQQEVLSIRLNGDRFLSTKYESVPMSLNERIGYARFGNRGAIAPPTGTQREAFEQATEMLQTDIATLKELHADKTAMKKQLIDKGILPPEIDK